MLLDTGVSNNLRNNYITKMCVSVKNNASGYFEDDTPFLNTRKDRNNIKVCLCAVLPYSQNSIPLLEGYQASHLVFPTTAVFKLS